MRFKQRCATPNFSLYSQKKCGNMFNFEIMQQNYEKINNNPYILNELNKRFLEIIEFYQLAATRDEMVLLHLT